MYVDRGDPISTASLGFQKAFDKVSLLRPGIFSVNQCKVMHVGAKNPDLAYTLMGANCLTEQERDPGVLVDRELTPCLGAFELGVLRIKLLVLSSHLTNQWEGHTWSVVASPGHHISQRI